jgi:protein-S-isoprenylcysteine O-methyltransferase Ste14
MGLRATLDLLALFIGSGYCTIPLFWLMTHPFVERWRKLGRRSYIFILPLWAVVIAIVFLIVWPFRFAHFYVTWLAWAPAAMLFFLGLWIYRAGLQSFHHTQASGLAELEPCKHRQQLVTTGIRSRVRHPIYLGHVFEILGLCVGTGLIALYMLAALAVLTGAVMIRVEDRELETRFGEEYREYRERVPAIVFKLKPTQPRIAADHANKS